MVDCGPACAVPSCEATPTVAFGSGGSRGFGRGLLGYGSNFGYGSGLGYGSGFGSGYGYGYGRGGSIESAANLGVLAGVIPSCVNQLPPTEVVINPAPIALTIPGAVLSATCEPVAVGGYAPCAVNGVGLGGFSSGFNGGLYGGRFSGLLGSRFGSLGRRGSVCGPCF